MQSKEGIGSVYVDIKFDKIDQEIAKLKGSVDKSARDTEATYKKAFAGIASAVGTIGLARLGTEIIGAATKWDSMEKSLLYVEKTQAAVNKRLQEFRIIAKEPGIGLQQLTQGYIGFTSAGIKAEPAIRLMRELANNMAAMGKGATEIERVNYQLIQMKSKGIPQLEDLRVIQEAMPNINKIIEKAFESTDIEKLVKGGLDADKFIAGITEAMSKQERATTGARNAQDNFNDSLFQFKAALGESVLPVVTDLLTEITKLLDKFNSMPEATQKVIGGGVMVGGGLLGVGLAIGGIATIIPSAVTGITSLGEAFTALSTVIMANPLAAAALGIGTIGGGLALAAQSTTVQDWLYGKPEKPKPLTLDEAKAQGAGLKLKSLGAVPVTPYSKAGITTPVVSPELKKLIDSYTNFDLRSNSIYSYDYAGQLTRQARAGIGEPYTQINPYEIPTSYGSLATPYFQAHYAQQPPSEIALSNMDYMMGYHPIKIPELELQPFKDSVLEDQQEIMKGWSTGIEKFSTEWDDLWVETQNGLKDVKTSWTEVAQQVIQTGNLFADVLNTILNELGYDTSGWKYKDPKLEAERQAQMKAYAKETTPIGWFNKIMGWTNQAAGIALPLMMAEGGSGIVNKPTMFIAGEAGAERVSFEPIGKGGRSGIGTHIQNLNVYPTANMDPQSAENMVVRAYNDAVRHGRIN